MARQVAAHVYDFTIVTRDNRGAVVIGMSYQDRRVAFAQRTRRENASGINVYVATRKGDRVAIYSNVMTRLLAIDVSPMCVDDDLPEAS